MHGLCRFLEALSRFAHTNSFKKKSKLLRPSRIATRLNLQGHAYLSKSRLACTRFCPVSLSFFVSSSGSIRLLINPFIHSCMHSFIHPFIDSYIHSFILSFTHACIHPFILSFIISFILSFVHTLITTLSSIVYSLLPCFLFFLSIAVNITAKLSLIFYSSRYRPTVNKG